MINIDAIKSASLSATKLAGSNITNLPMVASKAKTDTQDIGVYDLIYPFLHENYPTRDEIDKLIKDVFIAHHSTNWHLPISAITPSPGSPIGMPGNTVSEPVPLIPKEKVVGKVKVRSGSPVNAIGYGV